MFLLAAVVAVACSGEPLTLDATDAFSYPAAVDPRLERVAVLVTITNRSGDDLQVDPATFVVRDIDHRIFPANPIATVADARLVEAAAGRLGLRGVLPLPVVTLRQEDLISGFVVFDIPSGVRPAELIWRQSDTDHVVNLPSER